jgi:ATP-binding cassette subfamily B protein
MNAKYRLIWQLTRGERLRYGGALLALVLGSCCMYLVPLVPQVVLDGVLARDPGRAAPLVRRVVSLAGGREFLRAQLWLAAAAIVGLTAVAGAFTFLRARWSALASESIARRVRDRLFDHLAHLPVAYHDKAETGDVVQRCTSDVETLRQFLASQVVEIGRAGLMMLVPIPLMIALEPRLALVSIVFVPPIVAFSLVFFTKAKARFKLVDEAEGRMTSTLQENLTGIRVVRSFARQEFEKEKFGERIRTYRDLDRGYFRLLAWYWSISDFMCLGQKAVLVAVGGYWLARGEIPVGTFYFFLAAVNMFIWPIRMLGRILTELGKATVAIGRIGEILEHPRETEPADRGRDPLTISGVIVFDQVSFAHAGGPPVLDNVSFHIGSGQTLALIGPSGAGKSTIVHLILRFYDPSAGSIRLDEREITTLGRKALRAETAVVMQEPFLFSKTLRENIRLGRASAGDEEIAEAASAAAVHDAIAAFEAGYDTLVGERGVTLSGGQRQRVALARALVREPAVLILDDALSAVDTETERMILDALRARRGRYTTIVIAHRLSTLMHADRIVVLDRGRVIEEGTHEGLVAAGGLYRRLWQIQTSLEEDLREELAGAAGETSEVAT